MKEKKKNAQNNLIKKIIFNIFNTSTGWVQIPIKDVRNRPIRTFMIQIAVISNHQNGRDTHMRQIRIHSPIEGRKYPLEESGKFTTLEFQQYSTIR